MQKKFFFESSLKIDKVKAKYSKTSGVIRVHAYQRRIQVSFRIKVITDLFVINLI